MYVRPMLVFSLFLVMLIISTIPVDDEPVIFMNKEEEVGNPIKELNLNLRSDDVAISFLELDSGEATLVKDRKGRNVLINTGSDFSRKQFRQQLKVFQVEKIDALILTNLGKQYTGNLSWLLEGYEIDEIYTGQNTVNDVIDTFQVAEEVVNPLKPGDAFQILDMIDVDVKYLEKRKEYDRGGLVLDLIYGDHHLLYMGVSNETADTSITNGEAFKAALIKVGGFGHYFGTSRELLDHINPQVAIIFKKNGYTASERVLTRLDEHWTEILLPNEQGIVMVKANKKTFEITQIPLITPGIAQKSSNSDSKTFLKKSEDQLIPSINLFRY